MVNPVFINLIRTIKNLECFIKNIFYTNYLMVAIKPLQPHLPPQFREFGLVHLLLVWLKNQ